MDYGGGVETPLNGRQAYVWLTTRLGCMPTLSVTHSTTKAANVAFSDI